MIKYDNAIKPFCNPLEEHGPVYSETANVPSPSTPGSHDAPVDQPHQVAA